MNRLNVEIEVNGEMITVGEIAGNSSDDACFMYDAAFLRREDATPVSISLPLNREPFSPEKTRTFFEGLLPEGFTRLSVAQWMKVDERDYVSILHGLGRECLGAICITEDGEQHEAGYEKIKDEELCRLASEGAEMSAEYVTRSHLSLAGASGKVGLYFNAEDRAWYLPKGTAPSTHIVKQSHVRLDHIVLNEQLCMLTAAICGLNTPKSFIINTEDKGVLFATERYDRTFSGSNRTINNLVRPLRLHQEDFAQAMGIPSAKKYEREQDNYLAGMFQVLRQYSSNPIKDQIELWDAVIFDYLIGNTDAHIKNFSLIYSKDLKSIRLSPIYDCISTVIYDRGTRDMSLSIGQAYSIDDIDIQEFREEARKIGMGEQMAMQRFNRMCDLLPEALSKAAGFLETEGYSEVNDIKNLILEKGGIAKHK